MINKNNNNIKQTNEKIIITLIKRKRKTAKQTNKQIKQTYSVCICGYGFCQLE